jgi:hypothetical protein
VVRCDLRAIGRSARFCHSAGLTVASGCEAH